MPPPPKEDGKENAGVDAGAAAAAGAVAPNNDVVWPG